MLTHVPTIDQKTFKDLVKLSIRCNSNILIIGPSGGGKTIIAQEACSEENCRLIYINLSVLERTDFQGFPVLDDDKQTVRYATPSYLPFSDASSRQAREVLLKAKGSINDASLLKAVEDELKVLDEKDKVKSLSDLKDYFAQKKGEKVEKHVATATDALTKLLDKESISISENEKIVILFDEVDKAATETAQTLLEFLQFGSINGRKLNVRACILTGNLPDEHAHTNQISHAITKRCSTYRLDLDFELWRSWAFKNGVHEYVVQFLTTESTLLYNKAPDGDPTAYALPSPRTWTHASDILNKMDEDEFFSRMPGDRKSEVQHMVIAGNVGELAANKFAVWYNHYRKWDSAVRELVENGKNPNIKGVSCQEQLVVALAAAAKVYVELKPNNEKKIEKYTKNVYSWLADQTEDVQHAAIKITFGGDMELIRKYKLASIEEFTSVFKKINKKLKEYSND